MKSAFTLVEVLIIIVVLMLLAAVIVPTGKKIESMGLKIIGKPSKVSMFFPESK